MASVRRLKKNVSAVLGELVDTLLIWNLVSEQKNNETEKIIGDIYDTYDKYLQQINHPEGKKGAFYKQLLKTFEQDVNAIIAKINALN